MVADLLDAQRAQVVEVRGFTRRRTFGGGGGGLERKRELIDGKTRKRREPDLDLSMEKNL